MSPILAPYPIANDRKNVGAALGSVIGGVMVVLVKLIYDVAVALPQWVSL